MGEGRRSVRRREREGVGGIQKIILIAAQAVELRRISAGSAPR